ncbi:MAG: acetyl-CoA carboxylase biotin carboxyl carrier protein [Brockia lithotrophica]|nr:acetyl-CoA carboxylase biotin carboxyl carrier protein [Brockia lithotrophica]
MEISEIKELLLLFDASTLAYLRWERGDERLILRKAPRGSEAADFPGGSGLAGVVSYPEAKPQAIWEDEGVASEHARPSEFPEVPGSAEEASESLESVRAPLVGTFYARPEPTAPPFVRVGDRVTPDTVVCLIEAMKIFNEIKAGVHGIVHAVLAEDGQLVEYGQPLFLIRKEG